MESEIKLSYKTRDNVNPRGKARVYYSYHPNDFIYLEHIAKLLLEKQDCAVYYYDYAEQGPPRVDELAPLLREMQLIVIPVTSNFLFEDCVAYNFELRYALDNHIPILPLLQDSALGAEFNRKCTNLQFFDEYATDITAISFDEKLGKFLQSVLADDGTVKRIQAAFDAYVFLSYRKKDREYAHKLMSLIHTNPLCRDIAIWYDEFLLPGEPFDKAIEAMLLKSDLFALLVTPNLINEDNYVQNTEFPAAKDAGKAIVAAEAKPTNKEKLKKLFKDLPKCVKLNDAKALNKELINKLKHFAVRENDSPEHNFLIGLAFLMGIDVENDPKRAVKLITDAAEAGLAEASRKLADIYYHGIGAVRDIQKAADWQRSYVDGIQPKLLKDKDGNAVFDLLRARTDLADYLLEAERPTEAEQVHLESNALLERLAEEDFETYAEYLSIEYINTSTYYFETANEAQCESFLLKSSQLNEERLKRNPDADKGGTALNYHNLGMLYLKKGDFERASDWLNKSRALFADLVLSDADKYSYYYALTCDSLGGLYHHSNQVEKAEELIDCAVGIKEHLAILNPEAFKGDLALSYNNAFAFFGDQNNYKKAAEFMQKALALFEELIQENPERYRAFMAQCCQNAGLFCKEHNRFSEAEKYLLSATGYFQRLARTFPERFSGDLADNLNVLGLLYYEMKKPDKAEEYQVQSVEMLERLYDAAPERFAIDLARGYSNLGQLRMLSDTDEALTYYLKSVSLFEQCKAQTTDCYFDGYASVCNNLALYFMECEELEQAYLWAKKSLNIRKQMSAMNPSRYDGELGLGYNNIGLILLEQGYAEDAFSNLKTAIEIYLRLGESDPELNREELAGCYANAFSCKNMTEEPEEAFAYLLDAISEYETLEDRTPGIFAEDLSICYNEAGIACQKSGDDKNAERYYMLSAAILKKYQAEAHLAYNLSVSLENLGVLFDEGGEYQKAIEYYQSAAQVILVAQAQDIDADTRNAQLIELYEKLIDACQKAGNYKLASVYKMELEKLNMV